MIDHTCKDCSVLVANKIYVCNRDRHEYGEKAQQKIIVVFGDGCRDVYRFSADFIKNGRYKLSEGFQKRIDPQTIKTIELFLNKKAGAWISGGTQSGRIASVGNIGYLYGTTTSASTNSPTWDTEIVRWLTANDRAIVPDQPNVTARQQPRALTPAEREAIINGRRLADLAAADWIAGELDAQRAPAPRNNQPRIRVPNPFRRNAQVELPPLDDLFA